ncbi:MAG: DUF1207 domain-containing protein [Bacteriovoracaceae bacterium]|nr:DUF1207 domain-containing protein [Bacteriovoracaceae bacterium]
MYSLLALNYSGGDFNYLPKGQLFPHGIADTNNPTTSLSLQATHDSNIPHAERVRLVTKLGTTLKLIKAKMWGKTTQLDLGAMMKQQTDTFKSFDLIGWDGIIRSNISIKWSDKLSYKFGFQHRSAHRGDEYLINNKELIRKNFTRDENLIGVSYRFTPEIRSYFEVGHRVTTNDFNDAGPLRYQTGLEFERGKYYVAVDLESEATHDYTPATNFQMGLQHKDLDTDKIYRAGFEIYSGQVRLAEFSETREHLVAIGIWIDL